MFYSQIVSDAVWNPAVFEDSLFGGFQIGICLIIACDAGGDGTAVQCIRFAGR
jgi:hypothetical protein